MDTLHYLYLQLGLNLLWLLDGEPHAREVTSEGPVSRGCLEDELFLIESDQLSSGWEGSAWNFLSFGVTERNRTLTGVVGSDLHNVTFSKAQTHCFYKVKSDDGIGFVGLRGERFGCLVTLYFGHREVLLQRVEMGCKFQQPLRDCQNLWNVNYCDLTLCTLGTFALSKMDSVPFDE